MSCKRFVITRGINDHNESVAGVEATSLLSLFWVYPTRFSQTQALSMVVFLEALCLSTFKGSMKMKKKRVLTGDDSAVLAILAGAYSKKLYSDVNKIIKDENPSSLRKFDDVRKELLDRLRGDAKLIGKAILQLRDCSFDKKKTTFTKGVMSVAKAYIKWIDDMKPTNITATYDPSKFELIEKTHKHGDLWVQSKCKKHPKYKGIRKPSTKLGLSDGCTCAQIWGETSSNEKHYT